MKAELSGAGSAAVGAMEQQADIFLLSRGTWDSECDLLLHIFAMLPNMADWAACAMVCRMWRRLIPLARPYSLEERGINTRHTAWLERNSAMLSRLHTCSFGDMEGSVRDMHRHMCLVFENAPQIKRVIFGDTDWHMDNCLSVFKSLSPSIRSMYDGNLQPQDWSAMHPLAQLTRCLVDGELPLEALVHLREAIFLKCFRMCPVTVTKLPAYSKELLTMEIMLLPEKTCMCLAHVPRLQHLRVGAGNEVVIDLHAFPALLSFAFQGKFESCHGPAAEEFSHAPASNSIRWIKKGCILPRFQKTTLQAYSGEKDLSSMKVMVAVNGIETHHFYHPVWNNSCPCCTREMNVS